MLIGYPQGKNGNRIYDIRDKKIITSRDIKFIENSFPFANTNSEEDQIEACEMKFLDRAIQEDNENVQRRDDQDMPKESTYESDMKQDDTFDQGEYAPDQDT